MCWMSMGSQLAVSRRVIKLFGQQPNDAGKVIGLSLLKFARPCCSSSCSKSETRVIR